MSVLDVTRVAGQRETPACGSQRTDKLAAQMGHPGGQTGLGDGRSGSIRTVPEFRTRHFHMLTMHGHLIFQAAMKR